MPIRPALFAGHTAPDGFCPDVENTSFDSLLFHFPRDLGQGGKSAPVAVGTSVD
jgi:hypothetical protein